jgi:arsenate reductase-like glutaredoxin family protein
MSRFKADYYQHRLYLKAWNERVTQAVKANDVSSVSALRIEGTKYKAESANYVEAIAEMKEALKKPPAKLFDRPILVSSLSMDAKEEEEEDEEFLFEDLHLNLVYHAYLSNRPVILRHYRHHHLLLQLRDDNELIILFGLSPFTNVLEATSELHKMAAYWLPKDASFCIVTPGVCNTLNIGDSKLL